MKNKLFAGLVGLLIMSAFGFGCKRNASDSIAVDIQMYTFQGNGGTKTINVSASGKWTVSPGATWIEVANVTTSSFDVVVGQNNSGSLRDAQISLTCGTATTNVVIAQSPADTKEWMFRLYNDLASSVISPSGKYIGGYYSAVENNQTVSYVVFIDTTTETRTEIGPYAGDALLINGAWACTDNGILFLSTSAEDVVFDISTRDYTKLEAPAVGGMPSMQQVAADNTTWVGWSQLADHQVPVLWQDGVASQLPYPDRGYRGGQAESVLARGISADASVIYGSTWDNRDFGMLYWTAADGFATCKWAGEDVYAYNEESDQVNGLITWSGQYNISESGKWIAGTYYKEYEDNLISGTQVEGKYPAFFNTETGKTTVFTEFGDGSGLSVFGNIGMIGTPSFQTAYGYVVNLETGENLGTLSEWVLGKFGMIIPAGYGVYMPADNIVWGATTYNNGLVIVWNWFLGPVAK